MMTSDKKIETMHERARLIRKARDKTITDILGTVSVLMLAVIIVFISMLEGEMHPVGDSGQLGSSLLFEGAGGYVLTAVIAFTAAVVLTALCIRKKNRKKGQSYNNDSTGDPV